ncbi:type 2 periplasmic-binding domain-containing protein [Jeotgalibaca ciconiae]|uniref:Extracellular solute-binding protein n=1 Tax=Jeotgalibaca ciconiae TaxID=2496265 RepID=A0A3Q9BJZ5_9LACT|nr:extracellular solute-binding protein [Jeotgalibaca ciconiae]AZP04167.1 extracellular solute-binding protein [Jeotgalibaca ciconiae]HJB22798.1 extracellular solute-binding protein [Candidatus Jeotgalibaca pullicola]
MNKIVKWSLAALSCATLLAGCGNGNDASSDGVTKENNQATDADGIRVYSAFIGVAGKELPEDNRLNKALAEVVGARAEVTWLTGQTAKERIGVMIAGGEYPDLVDASDGYSQMVDAGGFVPLEDYIDDYPNLKALYTDLEWEKIKAANDGHIYTIPQFSSVRGENMETTYGQEAFWIQKRVLQWADYPEITTVDEYFDLINAYLAEHPETDGQPTIGFEILSDDWRYFALENPPAFLAGYPNDGAAIVDPDTLEAKVYDRIPEAKEYFKKLSEQFAKGVIDPETFTAKYDQYIAKISSGRVLGMIDQNWQFEQASNSLRSQGKDELTYIPFGLVLDPSVKPQYKEAPSLNTNGGIGITISNDDIEGTLEFLDGIVSEEAMIIRSWGEEGIDYEVDEEGKFYRTEEQRANWRNTDWVDTNGLDYGYLPAYKGMLPDGINAVLPHEQPEEFRSALVDIDVEILEAYGHEKWADFMAVQDPVTPWFPIYTERGSWSNNDPAGVANQKMTEVKMKWLPQVVMGGPDKFEENWEAYMADYEANVDYKVYEDTLTEEVKRRVEVEKEILKELGE